MDSRPFGHIFPLVESVSKAFRALFGLEMAKTANVYTFAVFAILLPDQGSNLD
jgi:hypothetical protein